MPVSATPPPWAPAHGWRRKHESYHHHERYDHDEDSDSHSHNCKHYRGYTGHEWPRDYGIIEGRCDRAAVGAVLGGVVGGVIGSQIGKGSDRVVAIVAGTVIGAVIGHEIGESMDEADRACTGHALELAHDGQRVRWANPNTGVSYVVTPIGDEGNCRRFELEASRGGRSQTTSGRACRSSDGLWQMAGAH